MNTDTHYLPIVASIPEEDVEGQLEDRVYIVERREWDNPSRLAPVAYARGDPVIIKAYYDSPEYKDVSVRPLAIEDVTIDRLDKRQQLVAEKTMHLRRLGELERELLQYNS